MSEQERLGTPEDMEARQRMCDQIERSYYEHEGAKLRGVVPAGEVGELVEYQPDLSGLLLALGLILSRPISDANRQHFAAQCFDAADRIAPGVSAIARSVLQGGD